MPSDGYRLYGEDYGNQRIYGENTGLKNKRILSMVLSAVLVMGVWQQPVAAETLQLSQSNLYTEAQSADGVTVTTTDEFTTALKNKQSPIIVSGTIVLGDETASDGRMKPVKIPENTVIQGTEGSSINCRCPIQLTGGNVTVSNVELTFSSADAMSSVPHREIFLAGYDLTLDNVSTYLEGQGGSLGNIGGNEEELLPTVYAGGFEAESIEDATVGTNAALTVKNSNSKTVFQAIYLGNDAGSDNKEPYTGDAVLNLDCKVTVREGVYSDKNTSAMIQITGDGGAQTKTFVGNANTTLTVTKSNISGASISGVGNVVLEDLAWLQMQAGELANVTLSDNACLDFAAMTDAVVNGNFTGATYDASAGVDGCGILVLNSQGSLAIGGKVTGTTIFRTGGKVISGVYETGRNYITALAQNAAENNFVLPESDVANGFVLEYQNGAWTLNRASMGIPEIGRITIDSWPTSVDISKITGKTDESIYCKVSWYDADDELIDYETVEDYGFYDCFYYVFPMRADYWESDSEAILDEIDWSTPVMLESSWDEDGIYYLKGSDDNNALKTGDYVFLFLSEYQEKEHLTVAEMKALGDAVKAEMPIRFYDSSVTPEPPEDIEDPETPVEPPEETEKPAHTHSYVGKVTRESTCVMKGIKTYTCSCGVSYTEELPLKAHKEVVDAAKKATCTKDGKTAGSHCSVCGKVLKKQETIYRPKTVKLKTDSYVYDGKAKKPSVKVYDSKGKVISSSNYTVAWKNNKNVGKATAEIRFTGKNYSGTIKQTFTIKPKGTSLTNSPEAAKSAFTVKWKKQCTQTKGYEIQYSTNSKFSGKTTKTVKVENNKTTTKKITKLQAKKKYYVRVRTYQTVKVNGKSTKIYSEWSKAKTVTTKK